MTECISDPYLSSPTTGATSFIIEEDKHQNSSSKRKEKEFEPEYSVIRPSKEKTRSRSNVRQNLDSVDEIDATINVKRRRRPTENEPKISTISYPLQRQGK